MDDIKRQDPNRPEADSRSGFWGTIILNIVLMAIYAYSLTFIFQADRTPVMIIASAILLFVIAATVASFALTLRRRSDLGLLITYSALLVLVLSVTALFDDRALSSTFSILIVSVIGLGWLFPRQSRRLYTIDTIVTLVLIWSFEWLDPAWRQSMKMTQVGPFGAIIFGILSAIILLRQSRETVAGSLRLKITVWTGAIFMVSSIILGVYSVITTRQSAIRTAENEAQAFAESQARQIRADTEIPLDTARALAQALTAIKDPSADLSLTRDQVNALLRQVLVENESFLGTYTLWESNAFDGLDDAYRNTPVHDQTGRFIPYWVRADDGSVSVIALEQYETPGIGDWYLLPRQTKKETIIAPLIYPIEGVDTVMASFVVPIIYEDNFYGIAGVDAPIAFVQQIVDSVNLYNGKADAVLLTSSGTLIGVRNRPELVNQPAAEIYPDFADLQARIAAGEPFISLSPDGQSLRAFAPVNIGQTGTHWSFGLIIPFSEITAPATASALRQALISTALILIALLILWYFTGQIVRPIRDLTTTANAISQGDLTATANVQSADETGVLASTFNAMTSQLRGTLATLEERVAERTHSLELAADVGRSVSQVRALDVMLKDAAEIIRSRFNLYYVQVYLANPTQNALVLQAGTGTAGAELISRGHRLPLDTGSINGRAAVEKHSVVISNTTVSTTFRPNPLLPDTRSEMAVPLLVGDQVVGVLDLQGRVENALTPELLPAFEALAGQLAIAIQNANLLAEAEQARAEVESQTRRLVRAGWDEYLDAIHKPEQTGFVYAGDAVHPLQTAGEAEPPAEGSIIAAPIAITGEELGSLVVELSEQKQQPQNVELINIVARQVAQQIENLRLLESAERYRAEAEQAARQLTRDAWKSYVETGTGARIGYIYDLKEVLPVQSDHEADEYAITLPLKVRNQTIGKMAVKGIEPQNDEAVELASAVAERLGAHIESLRQYGQTQSALAQSEKLFEASRRLTQANDLQELVKATVETLNIPAINRASLGIFSYNAAGELETMTDIANWWNGVGTEVAPIGISYSAQSLKVLSIFLSDNPVFLNDTFHDERMGEAELQVIKRLNVRAVAVLPLLLGTHQIGVLRLQAEEPYNFTPEETRLFSSLAPQIATVLENRRQYERAQKQAERESTLNVISQKIQSATSVEAVLQIAARELGHALGAPLTIAQLGMKERGNGG